MSLEDLDRAYRADAAHEYLGGEIKELEDLVGKLERLVSIATTVGRLTAEVVYDLHNSDLEDGYQTGCAKGGVDVTGDFSGGEGYRPEDHTITIKIDCAEKPIFDYASTVKVEGLACHVEDLVEQAIDRARRYLEGEKGLTIADEWDARNARIAAQSKDASSKKPCPPLDPRSPL